MTSEIVIMCVNIILKENMNIVAPNSSLDWIRYMIIGCSYNTHYFYKR